MDHALPRVKAKRKPRKPWPPWMRFWFIYSLMSLGFGVWRFIRFNEGEAISGFFMCIDFLFFSYGYSRFKSYYDQWKKD